MSVVISHRQKEPRIQAQQTTYSNRPLPHNEEKLQLAEQLEDKTGRQYSGTNQGPILVLRLLFGASAKTKDMNEAAKLLKQAAAFSKQHLRFTRQLEDEQIRIQQQIFARFGLGLCYIERVKRIKNTDKAEALFKETGR